MTYRQRLEKPYQPPEELRILETIAKMNDNQVWLAAYAMGFTGVGDVETPTAEPEVIDGVTKSYAISKIDRAAANDGKLEPIRSYADGTPDRRRMEALVNWLVTQGLAEPARGNQPAKITNIQEAKKRL